MEPPCSSGGTVTLSCVCSPGLCLLRPQDDGSSSQGTASTAVDWTRPPVPTELISVLIYTLAQFSRNRSRALEQKAFPFLVPRGCNSTPRRGRSAGRQTVQWAPSVCPVVRLWAESYSSAGQCGVTPAAPLRSWGVEAGSSWRVCGSDTGSGISAGFHSRV